MLVHNHGSLNTLTEKVSQTAIPANQEKKERGGGYRGVIVNIFALAMSTHEFWVELLKKR